MNIRVVLVFAAAAGLLIAAGLLERRHIAESVGKIGLRINVNGIRGKSTATRFITAILDEAGYKVVGKTTGTSARMIRWGEEEEVAIKRRPVGPNIGEQVAVLRQAAEMGADALVCECMAVKPEYQEIYQQQIVQANIVVLTNIVEDHLDEMGPTTRQIAWAFAKTIPYNGTLVFTPNKHERYLRRIAAKRNTQVVCVDPEEIPASYLQRFPYMVFKNNCAIGLGVARALGISDEFAMRAMLKAHPDPGATQIVRAEYEGTDCYLVNAFAANEPTSSLEILEQVCHSELPQKDPMLILCCRDDRIDRSHQFVEDFLPCVNMKTLLVIGTGTLEVIHEFQKGRFPGIEECVDLTGQNADVIIEQIRMRMDHNFVFCAGNIHGTAEEFLEEFVSIRI